jgi:5-formyltetrahydrofolate cyclo-ligase
LELELVIEKTNLRTEMKTHLRALREKQKDHTEKTASLNRHVQSFLHQKTGIWAGFLALPSEPNIIEAIDQSAHIQWVYPRVVGNDLSFHSSKNRESFVIGSFGIVEPSGTEPQVDIESIDGFLVPGVAFGQDGARLGRGKGFYDRTLSQTAAERVGVCYSLQLLNKGSVPVENRDVFMTTTITEDGMNAVPPIEEN